MSPWAQLGMVKNKVETETIARLQEEKICDRQSQQLRGSLNVTKKSIEDTTDGRCPNGSL